MIEYFFLYFRFIIVLLEFLDLGLNINSNHFCTVLKPCVGYAFNLILLWKNSVRKLDMHMV